MVQSVAMLYRCIEGYISMCDRYLHLQMRDVNACPTPKTGIHPWTSLLGWTQAEWSQLLMVLIGYFKFI